MQTIASKTVRALVSTIEPIDGGVPSMTRWICQLLVENNITPILAWYAPWSTNPGLSIPSYKIIKGRKPKAIKQLAFEKYDANAIGCWLPELEFTHYYPTRHWQELIHQCNLHLAVSGNPLCASPYIFAKVPFLAWIATPWNADRRDRLRKFSISRRVFDGFANKPFVGKLEKRIIGSPNGQILSLSHYTSRELHKIHHIKQEDVMYMPVDTELFSPNISKRVKWRIGFSGRYADPRKNIRLLLAAIRILHDKGYSPELLLVGERNAQLVMPLVKELGLDHCVSCLTNLLPHNLANLLQTLDVFAVPSHQEGLCIAALEAMACGVPVVSTRCGGPEDYVTPGITGELVESDPHNFALALENICLNSSYRQHLSKGAVDWIASNASQAVSRKIFQKQLNLLIERRGYDLA